MLSIIDDFKAKFPDYTTRCLITIDPLWIPYKLFRRDDVTKRVSKLMNLGYMVDMDVNLCKRV